MSYSISNLGNAMSTDWNRPIRIANYNNLIARQKDLDRISYNGELSGRNTQVAENEQQRLNKSLELVGGMGTSNNKNAWNSEFRMKTNGGSQVSEPLSHQINPNKFSVVTNREIDHSDRLHQIYLKWAKGLQTNQGMANSIQNPTSNYPCKRYMRY